MSSAKYILAILAIAGSLLLLGATNRSWAGDPAQANARQIIVPDEDRFTPFAITVHVGQKVQWVNNDTDDHTLVSNDAFNTAGHKGVNVLLPANGGTYTLTFNRAG